MKYLRCLSLFPVSRELRCAFHSFFYGINKTPKAQDSTWICFHFNFYVRSGLSWTNFEGKPLTCSQLRHDLVNFIGKLPPWLRKSQGLNMSVAKMISLSSGGHGLAFAKASNKFKSKKNLRGRVFLMLQWKLMLKQQV